MICIKKLSAWTEQKLENMVYVVFFNHVYRLTSISMTNFLGFGLFDENTGSSSDFLYIRHAFTWDLKMYFSSLFHTADSLPSFSFIFLHWNGLNEPSYFLILFSLLNKPNVKFLWLTKWLVASWVAYCSFTQPTDLKLCTFFWAETIRSGRRDHLMSSNNH